VTLERVALERLARSAEPFYNTAVKRTFIRSGASLLLLFLMVPGVLSSAAEPGESAPPFVNPNLQKRHVWSRDYLGKGWVIVDFFATDCEGCKKEMPILERLFQDYREQGLSVLVFATDPEGDKVVKPYFDENPTVLTILVDRYQVAVKKYGVEEIPTVFLVDPQGLIVLKKIGYSEKLYAEVSALLSAGS
jgi:thiol-disulfide isomerase/thioredoxin